MSAIRALAAALLLGAPASAADPLGIAATGSGSAAVPVAEALARIVAGATSGQRVLVLATSAPTETAGLVASGEAGFAIVPSATIYQAYAGTGPFEGAGLASPRAVAALYTDRIQIVVADDSPVQSLADLKGARIAVAYAAEPTVRALLAASGLVPEDVDLLRLDPGEVADAVANGDVEAGIWLSAVPAAPIAALARRTAIRLVPLTAQELAKGREVDPGLTDRVIEAGLYQGQADAVATLGVANLLVTSADMPDDLVYAVTRATFENLAALSGAGETSVAFTLSAAPIPLHPGALRYFEETGATIPDALRP